MAAEILDQKPVESGQGSEPGSRRAEIDTSAPFESVKEAATRFGGMGFWKPSQIKLSECDEEVFDIVKVGEQAAQLEQDLIAKEKETCDVLQELESTKNVVEKLKLKLQKEANEINTVVHGVVGVNPSCPSSAPGFILLELKQAKLNLVRTTSDLAEIRASVDVYNKKIEKERLSLEKTRERLTSNSSKISSLEQEVNQTKHSVKLVKDNEIMNELQKLSSEIEQFRKVGEWAKVEVSRAMSEIEMTKSKIRTAEIHLYAAKKMKEAARASEAVALAQIKAISKSEKGESSENVILTLEEYSSLVTKAWETDEASKSRVLNAMVQVDEANVSKMEILQKVEEATEEVKITKTALEEALCRVEAANQGKLVVEEAMRNWRFEKKRYVHNSTKFKNSHSVLPRKEIDLNVVENEFKPVLKPTLSIGQILSRKLLLAEDYEYGIHVENTKHDDVSLSQMLSKPNVDSSCVKKSEKENNEPPAKRKKFGFGKISRLVTKQNKKKKKQPGGGSVCRNI